MHWYWWHNVEPRRMPHEIFTDMGSNLRPKEEIGIAWSQSEEFIEDTASKRPFSVFDGAEINNFW